jgi:hypothetical protein
LSNNDSGRFGALKWYINGRYSANLELLIDKTSSIYLYVKLKALASWIFLSFTTFEETPTHMSIKIHPTAWQIIIPLNGNNSQSFQQQGPDNDNATPMNKWSVCWSSSSITRQIDGFIKELLVSPPITLTATIYLKYCWKWC